MMRVSIITSTRADFGLLKNLILNIRKNKNFSLKVIASGSHFSKKFGYTYKEIKNSKIKIDKKIVCEFNSNNIEGASKIMSKSILETSKILKNLKTELLIVLGDRYEILASVISAHLSRIPVAHIHGGEVTQGAIDDAFRHSITKMSHIHFSAKKKKKKRIIQLGENPLHVYSVGGLGIDSISKTNFLTKKELEKKFNFKFNKYNFIINFHPETINKNLAKKQINELLLALSKLNNTNFIFTMPGADLENSVILKEIKFFVQKHAHAYFFKSLGQINYFSFLNHVDGMIGNSSSGILEKKKKKKGTINLGNRQLGRLFAKSIINTEIKKNKIEQAVKSILSIKFKKRIKNHINPYGKPGASDRIIKILEKIIIKKVFNKKFFDINKI